MRGLQLVVADAAAARDELVSRGVEASEITVFDERDGGTFFGFADPDGNTWAVQQIKARAEQAAHPRRGPAAVRRRAGGLTPAAIGERMPRPAPSREGPAAASVRRARLGHCA